MASFMEEALVAQLERAEKNRGEPERDFQRSIYPAARSNLGAGIA
jgi:hypothetical protein